MNETQYQLYISKMNSIRMMSINFRKNYEDMFNTDIDYSGFIIVKGTLKEFGTIVFVNKTFCAMTDFIEEELLNNKINTLMPALISEKHHEFWNFFNETGKPQFVER